MTGAVLPAGSDCVVMQEKVRIDEQWIVVADTLREGENIRQAGEDLARGTIALEQGKRLQPADLGLLASLGIRELTVRRRLRVAFFSSGDELRSLGQPLDPGQIYDSNRYILQGVLRNLGFDLIDLGVVEDDPILIGRALETASREADAIITTGGVSVGEADFLREAMTRQGQMHFWQIAMKPGRPLAYGRIGNVPLFGLPGNPVAVMVTFYQFVQPALLKMSGVDKPGAPRRFRVRSASRFRKIAGRTEYQRAVLEYDASGELTVRSTGKQGSGILRSMSEANCLVVLPSSGETINQGDWVEVQPFEGLLQ
jgi:molybdopterin molybdotransferase